MRGGELQSGLRFDEHVNEFKWIGVFYRDLTLLIFGLAGLDLADRKLPDKIPTVRNF
jgi:hypothetical protein